MIQCAFNHNDKGPRCCIKSDDGNHSGPHLFKCGGRNCPGLIWPASVMLHPITCVLGNAEPRIVHAHSKKL